MFSLFYFGSWLLASICHAEFSSASVRGEGGAMARGEILKRVQDDMMDGVRVTMERRSLAFLGLAIGR